MAVTRWTAEASPGPHLSATGPSPEELRHAVAESLVDRGYCRVADFPTDPVAYVSFLEEFGAPLPNYGAATSRRAYELHPKINRVRFEPRPSADTYVHERGGALVPHSARAWRHPRPAYFAMLMVDPGWTDEVRGRNGESLLVSWHWVLRLMEEEDIQFLETLRLLTETPLHFTADHVVEKASNLPLLYSLSDSKGPLDLGARVRGDFPSTKQALAECLSGLPEREAYLSALERFFATALDERVQFLYQMCRGELVILDNNRFGHGRLDMVPSRQLDGTTVVNPRELWSVAVEAV